LRTTSLNKNEKGKGGRRSERGGVSHEFLTAAATVEGLASRKGQAVYGFFGFRVGEA
jgi:hypothetical protein